MLDGSSDSEAAMGERVSGTAYAPNSARGEAGGEPAGVRARIPVLDGVRGLAIALVMLRHFLPDHDQPHSLVGRLFFFVSRLGWCGVDLFFVLSGFLITGILLDAKGTANYFRNFYARRTLRIFPLYYLVLCAIFVVVPLVWHGAFASPELAEIRRRQGWVWLYGTNLFMTWRSDVSFFYSGWLDLNPFWSLAVEEHFYLVWPAVVFLASRRALKWVCVGCMVASLLVRAGMAWRGGEMAWSIYVFTPCRADALAAGGLLAALLREDQAWVGRFMAQAKWWALGLGVLWIASLVANPGRGDFLSLTAGYSLAAIFFAVFVGAMVAAPVGGWGGWPLNGVALRGMGKYSYGLYVYHVVLGASFNRWFGVERLTPFFRGRMHLGGMGYGVSVLAYLAMAGGASFAIAWVSWNLFERQCLRLKKYFEYGAMEPVAGATGSVERP